MSSRAGAIAGMAALLLAGSPAHGALGRADGAMADQRGIACARSTASVRYLASIENASERSFQCLGLSIVDGAVKAIRLETHSFTSNGDNPEEHVVLAEFAPAVIASDRGAVLDGVPGHDAIVLRGQLASPPGKTYLVASYLYNGITGEYRSCQIMLDRAPGADWRLSDRFAQPISRIVVRTRQIPMIGAFGIAELEGACS